jgi:hypothetical protein
MTDDPGNGHGQQPGSPDAGRARGLPVEGYALIGGHPHSGAGRPERVGRLAVPAAVRLQRVLRYAAGG